MSYLRGSVGTRGGTTSFLEDEVFLAFSTYATIVVLKTMLMAPLTAYYRFTRGVGYVVDGSSSSSHDTKANVSTTYLE